MQRCAVGCCGVAWCCHSVSLGKDCNECVCFVLGDPKCSSNMFLMVLQTGCEGKRRVCVFFYDEIAAVALLATTSNGPATIAARAG